MFLEIFCDDLGSPLLVLAHYKENTWTFQSTTFSSADELYADADVNFLQDLTPAHTTKSTNT